MMGATLASSKCEPCTIGTPPLEVGEEDRLLDELQDWQLDRTSVHQLHKEYTFKDFVEALDFIQRVGALAEKEQHHPDINLHNYKQVTITLFTHKIKGLSYNDFIMAAKIDKLGS